MDPPYSACDNQQHAHHTAHHLQQPGDDLTGTLHQIIPCYSRTSYHTLTLSHDFSTSRFSSSSAVVTPEDKMISLINTIVDIEAPNYVQLLEQGNPLNGHCLLISLYRDTHLSHATYPQHLPSQAAVLSSLSIVISSLSCLCRILSNTMCLDTAFYNLIFVTT